MNFITASFARSSSGATTGFEELNLEVLAQQEGYILIYVSNEEEQANIAYFDDVNVTNKHSKVVQEESYFPFGLTFNSYKREYSKENKMNTFQDQEVITLGNSNTLQTIALSAARRAIYRMIRKD